MNRELRELFNKYYYKINKKTLFHMVLSTTHIMYKGNIKDIENYFKECIKITKEDK